MRHQAQMEELKRRLDSLEGDRAKFFWMLASVILLGIANFFLNAQGFPTP